MRFLPLILKDLKIILSDRKALLILIGMPIILFTILSFALQGSFSSGTDSLWDIEVAIVKEYDFEGDYNELEAFMTIEQARDIENIISGVFASEDLSFIKTTVMTYDEAMIGLENNELTSVIILPEYYIKDIAMNMSPNFQKPVVIKLLTNPEKNYSSSIVEKVVAEVSQVLSSDMIQTKVVYEVLSKYELNPEELVLDTALEPIQISYEDYKIDQLKTVNSAQYYSVAMMAMFILFGASYGSKFMLLEKRKFTLQRQQVAGVTPFKLVLGKLLIIFCVGLLQIVAMILTSSIGFKVYWGNPIMVFALTILTAFAVMGFGTILTGMALKTDSFKTLNLLESGAFQVIALFGGSYFPIYLMPEWFQNVSKLLLNGAALDVYLKVMMDAPVKELMPGMLSLGLNGVVFLSIGLWIITQDPSVKIRRV